MRPERYVDFLEAPAGDAATHDSGVQDGAFAVTHSALARVVAAEFARALNLPEVATDENFFDLGGDSLLGLGVLTRLQDEFGRLLPLALLYDAPTPAQLAEAVEAERRAPSCLVALREGAGQRPIFFCHGIGGSVGELFPLAGRLSTSAPLIGIQAAGLEGRLVPNTSVETKAALYVTEVTRVQPSGPYTLVGLSFGGLVTFEMTRLLQARGEDVTLVFLDSYPDHRFWPWRPMIAAMLQTSRRRLAELRDHEASEMPALFGKWFRTLGRVVYTFLRPATPRVAPAEAVPDYVQRVREAGYMALGAYRPRPLDTTVIFIRAAGERGLARNPAGIWGPLVRRLHVHDVPGDHRSIVLADVDSTAAALSAVLSATLGATAASASS